MFLFHDSCATQVVSYAGASVAQSRMRLTVVRSTILPATEVAQVQRAEEKAMMLSVVWYLQEVFLDPRCRSLQLRWLLRDSETLVLLAHGLFVVLVKIGFANAVCLT